jgi:hypothetical protein
MTSRRHSSRQPRLVVALLAVILGVLGLSSAPASARQPHFYGKSFGEAGSGPGQLSEPGGVAVSEVGAFSGDVYVVDQGNDRVEVFSAEGAYITQFNGAATPAGSFGWAKGESAPEMIAVDNSTNPLDPSRGDVYVADMGNRAVDKFTPEGAYIGQITKGALGLPFGGKKESRSIEIAVAVDLQGTVWVAQRNEEEERAQIDGFSDAVKNEFLSSFSTFTFEGGPLAVDREDDLYVAGSFLSGTSGGLTKFSPVTGESLPFGHPENSTDVAVDPTSGEVYLDDLETNSIVVYSSTGAFIQNFGAEQLSVRSWGDAINASSKVVYATVREADSVKVFPPAVLPDVSTGEASGLQAEGAATLNGSVDPDGVPLTSCRFEYASAEEYAATKTYAQSVACDQTPAGNNPVGVHAEVAVSPDTQYHYRLVAGNAEHQVENGETKGKDESFVAPAGPAIAGEAIVAVGTTAATLSAQINPGGLLTSYRVEYGAGALASSTPEVDIGAGLQSTSVRTQLSGLQPGTQYHLRFSVVNSLRATRGGELTFTTTQPTGTSALTLPDHRAYELVSSPSYNANVFTPQVGSLKNEEDFIGRGAMRAAANGEAVAYVSEAPPGSTAEGNGVQNQFLATRGANGWANTDLQIGETDEYQGFSNDLSFGVVRGEVSLPASPPTASSCKNVGFFERTSSDRAYHALVAHTSAAYPADCVGQFAGASANGGHLLFEGEGALTPEAKEGGEEHYDLYDSVAGEAHLVNILPNGESDTNARFGSPTAASNFLQVADYSNVISADGSHVFWSKVTPSGPYSEAIDGLYVRENDTQPQSPLGPGRECAVASDACTVRIDVPEPGAVGGSASGRFWTASGDGSTVFLTDESLLTRGSTAAPGEPDLYEYAVSPQTGRPGVLRDLTVAARAGEHADVLGVIGINETGTPGSDVYFVASGVLTVAANAEGHEPVAGQPNLYVSEGGELRFIATLSPADDELPGERIGDWQEEPGHRSAEVTPDGRNLVFSSTLALTGYDNRGLPEVFVFDADTGRIACASCNPSGEPPSNNLAGQDAGLYQLGAEAPISLNNTYTQRWISADGSQVFFETGQALAPQDTNGRQDVYEWEREGSNGCRQSGGCVYLLSDGLSPDDSYLLDASANGNDVFFVARSRLVAQAGDENMALYDARVDGGFPTASLACTGTGCQGIPPAPPIFATPASVTYDGVGNFPPSAKSAAPRTVKKKTVKKRPAKCAKGKQRRHGKCVKQRRSARVNKGRK